MRADVKSLVGKVFVAASNNICRFSFLADGALRVNWMYKPTENDINELNNWASRVLAADVSYSVGKEAEKQALDKFLKDTQ